INAVDRISPAGQAQDGDSIFSRIDDPVFGNAGAGILSTFSDQISMAIFCAAADDLHDQVGALPELLSNSLGMFLEHEDNIRLAKLVRPQPHSQRCKQGYP